MIERQLIEVAPDCRPMLAVVIHTEEEFDWDKPHDRNATGVAHMRDIHRAQAVFDEFGIVPNYVVDYPIATKPEAFEPLKAFADSGRALIGAHLHPWVSPPFDEEVNVRNSFPGNLPRALEYEKLRVLTERIVDTFGAPPLTYLAGRYGFGPNTGEILEALGYEVDISPAVPIDYGAEGGPDYSGYTSQPYWFGQSRRLLGLPGTGGYVGRLRSGGTALYRRLTRPHLRQLRISGAVARLRLMERIRLSPEDYSEPEMRRLTHALLADGLRMFVFSFHSPSVMPGGTPYVKSDEDREHFLEKCRRYFDFFMYRLKGATMTPLGVKAWLAQHSIPATGRSSSAHRPRG